MLRRAPCADFRCVTVRARRRPNERRISRLARACGHDEERDADPRSPTRPAKHAMHGGVYRPVKRSARRGALPAARARLALNCYGSLNVTPRLSVAAPAPASAYAAIVGEKK